MPPSTLELDEEMIRDAKASLFNPRHADKLAYLTEQRGFTLSAIHEFELGYHEGNGSYDRWRDRILIPVRDVFGKLVGYQGRAMFDFKEAGVGKFINNTGLVKSAHLYGGHLTLPSVHNWLAVVEGPMDVIACRVLGIPAVAIMGSTVSERQMFIIASFVEHVVTLANSDDAGSKMLSSVEIECEKFGLRHVPLIISSVVKGAKDVDDVLVAKGLRKARRLLRRKIIGKIEEL